jgi:hypothetical protein
MAYFFGHMIDNDLLNFARSLRLKIDNFSQKVFSGFDNEDADSHSKVQKSGGALSYGYRRSVFRR